jgi:hypothetical protein
MLKSLLASAVLIITSGSIALAQTVTPKFITLQYHQGVKVVIDCQRGLYQIEDQQVKRITKDTPPELLCQVASFPAPSKGIQI